MTRGRPLKLSHPSDIFFAYKSGVALHQNRGQTQSMWHGDALDVQFMHFALSMSFCWYNASVRIDSVHSVRCRIQVSLGLIQQNDTGHFHLNLFSLSESGRGVRVFESEQCSGHIVMATVGLVPEPHYLQWYTQRGWESDVIVHDNHVHLVAPSSRWDFIHDALDSMCDLRCLQKGQRRVMKLRGRYSLCDSGLAQ
jgi:hypothetical protein